MLRGMVATFSIFCPCAAWGLPLISALNGEYKRAATETVVIVGGGAIIHFFGGAIDAIPIGDEPGPGGAGIGGSGCFVAGTPVLVAGEIDEGAAAITASETTDGDTRGVLLGCGVLFAVAGVGGWQFERQQIRRKRKEDEELNELIDRLFGGTDLLDEDDYPPTSAYDAEPSNGDSDPWARFADRGDGWRGWSEDGNKEPALAECRRATGALEHHGQATLHVPDRMEPTVEPLTQPKQSAPQLATCSSKPGGFGRWWLAGCLLLASLFVGGAMFLPSGRPTIPPQQKSAAHSLLARSIETIRVGQRVLGNNPELTDADRAQFGLEPNQATWRKLHLRMVKLADAKKTLDIELLRPLEWIKSTGARPGGTIQLNLREFGAEGPAKVLMIEPCPPIGLGQGSVVTGTFAHEADDSVGFLKVSVEGLPESIHCTANHPFWSEDRQAYSPISEFRVGEHVRTQTAGVRRITTIAPAPRTAIVYNIEVHGEHVYEVGRAGILVHNKAARYRPPKAPGEIPGTGTIDAGEGIPDVQPGPQWGDPGTTLEPPPGGGEGSWAPGTTEAPVEGGAGTTNPFNKRLPGPERLPPKGPLGGNPIDPWGLMPPPESY